MVQLFQYQDKDKDMDFKPGNTGNIGISQYLTKDSEFGLIASNTVTVYGQTLVLKALSNAPIYKTTKVTFFSDWTAPDGVTKATHTLGTSTYVDNIAAVLVIPDLTAGTNKVYASWEGEGTYAAKSTFGNPIQILVHSANEIGGQFYVTATPGSGQVVAFEGSVTFTAQFTTSTQVSGNIRFYNDGVPIDSVPILNNQASLTVPYLTAGTRKIQASWPGGAIDGIVYGGVSYTFNYIVKQGTYVAGPLTLSMPKTAGVVLEGGLTLNAEVTYTYGHLPGTVTFYKGNTAIGSSSLVNNRATLSVPNTYVVGTYTMKAIWDGNQGAVPAYLPLTSNAVEYAVYERGTINSISLSVTPEPSVARVQDAKITAVLNTTTSVLGMVYFYSNIDYLIGTATIVNNVATLDTYGLSTGTHFLSARFSGSAVEPKYYSVTSTYITHEVLPGYPYPGHFTLTSSEEPVDIYTPLTLTVVDSQGTHWINSGTYYQTRPVEFWEVNQSVEYQNVYGNFTITDYQILFDTQAPGSYINHGTHIITTNYSQMSGIYGAPNPGTHWISYTNTANLHPGDTLRINLGPNKFGFYSVGSVNTQYNMNYAYGGSLSTANSVWLGFAGGEDVLRTLTVHALTLGELSDPSTKPNGAGTTSTGYTDASFWLSYYNNTSPKPAYNTTQLLARGLTNNQQYHPEWVLEGTGNPIGQTPIVTGNNKVKLLGSTNTWIGSSSSITISPTTFSTGTMTHQISAYWPGYDGFGLNGSTPYLGEWSNIITATVYIPSVTLTGNDLVLVSSGTVYNATISGDYVNSKAIQFLDGGRNLGTFNSSGNTGTLNLSAYSLALGQHKFTGVLTDFGVVSNTLTQTVVTSQAPTFNFQITTGMVSPLGRPMYIRNHIDGSVNHQTGTVTARTVSAFPTKHPTGNVLVLNGTSQIGSGTLVQQSASSSTVTYNFDLGNITNKVNNISLTGRYEGDPWNLSIDVNTPLDIRSYPLQIVKVNGQTARTAPSAGGFSNPTFVVEYSSGTTITLKVDFESDSTPSGLIQLYPYNWSPSYPPISQVNAIGSTATFNPILVTDIVWIGQTFQPNSTPWPANYFQGINYPSYVAALKTYQPGSSFPNYSFRQISAIRFISDANYVNNSDFNINVPTNEYAMDATVWIIKRA